MSNVSTFRARSTSDPGDIIVIRAVGSTIRAGHFSDPHAKLAGLTELLAPDGTPVNYSAERGIYTVVATGRTYEKCD